MNHNWSDYEMFLKPIHLKSAERVLTITRISEEDTHPQPGKTVKSPVLWFKELPFGLILSPTNRQTLIELFGDEVNACLGKPIAVKAVAMKVGGRDKQPIRIQKRRPAAPHVETSTGEIREAAPAAEGVTYPEHPETIITEPPRSELDAHFGTQKITAGAPCTLHNVKMGEISKKTSLPYHRLTTEDGLVGFCNGSEVKFAGNGHAAAGK